MRSINLFYFPARIWRCSRWARFRPRIRRSLEAFICPLHSDQALALQDLCRYKAHHPIALIYLSLIAIITTKIISLIAALLAVPASLFWGVIFALVTALYVWLLTPALRLFEFSVYIFRRVSEIILTRALILHVFTNLMLCNRFRFWMAWCAPPWSPSAPPWAPCSPTSATGTPGTSSRRPEDIFSRSNLIFGFSVESQRAPNKGGSGKLFDCAAKLTSVCWKNSFKFEKMSRMISLI